MRNCWLQKIIEIFYCWFHSYQDDEPNISSNIFLNTEPEGSSPRFLPNYMCSVLSKSTQVQKVRYKCGWFIFPQLNPVRFSLLELLHAAIPSKALQAAFNPFPQIEIPTGSCCAMLNVCSCLFADVENMMWMGSLHGIMSWFKWSSI